MSQTISYTYQPPIVSGTLGVLARSDGWFIPCDLANTDYQGFLQWLAAGNPAPAGWTGPTNPAGGTAG